MCHKKVFYIVLYIQVQWTMLGMEDVMWGRSIPLKGQLGLMYVFQVILSFLAFFIKGSNFQMIFERRSTKVVQISLFDHNIPRWLWFKASSCIEFRRYNLSFQDCLTQSQAKLLHSLGANQSFPHTNNQNRNEEDPTIATDSAGTCEDVFIKKLYQIQSMF